MSTTTSDDESSPRVSASRTPKVLALVVLWLAPEAQRGGSRLGEVLLMPEGACPPPCVFGRGDDTDDDPRTARLAFLRQRPGANASTPPLELSSLSRRQLLLRVVDGAIHVENVGRRDLVVDGNVVQRCVLRRGDMLEIKNRVVLMCVERPLYLPPLRSWQEQHSGAFGDADAFGFVGESPSAWALREQIAFVAPRNAHVLVTGESGTGKELAAHAVHGLSPRRRHRIVARNAATIPSGLVDAELFGNVAHYPNAGSPDRPGLVGEADESTLFLDEIGELPEDVQTHLLRVADASGDYQRLGESRRRRASFRLVGATNRSLDRIKPDLLARLPLRIVVPGLHERREDIPLLVRVLLQRLAESDAEMRLDFLVLAKEIAHWHHEKWDGSGYPDGLAGDDIPISARLMAVADVFDALISPRVYKSAMPLSQAREIIAAGRGKHFDPEIADAFLVGFDKFVAIAGKYPDGS